MTAGLGWARLALPVLVLPLAVGAVLASLAEESLRSTAGSRTVVDDAGRRVRFDPGERRALYMGMGAGEYLLMTRQPAHLLTSRSPLHDTMVRSSLMRRSVPGLDAMDLGLSPAEGAAANLETLLWRRPDVMITWSRLVDRFERVGVPAVGLNPVASTERLVAHARIFGEVVDDPRRGADVVARSDAAQGALAGEVRALAAAGHGPTKALFVYPSGRSWRTAHEFPEVVAAVGAENVGLPMAFSAGLDAERLLLLAPDVIVVVGGANERDDAAIRLMSDPALAAVPAVARRRVVRKPPGLSGYMNSAIELPVYERWLAEVLHPELAPQARTLAAEVIRRELGVVPSDAELDDLLSVHANRRSADAARFASRPG